MRERGFTLVELMISMALLSIVTLLLISTTNSTSSLWRYTTNRIEEFRGARTGFEEITRNLSQATLNTYWDYFYEPGKTVPSKYIRQSDLRFLSDRTETIFAGAPTLSAWRRPTHGVFFQAPLGMVDDPTNFSGLENLLNTWGYYIEFNKDTRPALIDNLKHGPPVRLRYRLMEIMEPSNSLSIYSYTSSNKTYNKKDWIYNPVSNYALAPKPPDPPAQPPQLNHVLAENVVALLLLPKLSPADAAKISAGGPAASLAPAYQYDSTASAVSGELSTQNQLPPVVQVTLVAIDETSAARAAKHTASFDPLLSSNRPDYDASLNAFTKADDYDKDLTALQRSLADQHLGYRVFTTDVSIRAAKWSRK